MNMGRPLDIEKLRKAEVLLRSRPHSAEQLAKKLKVSKRTAWRWLHRLEDLGRKVTRTGTGYPIRYSI